MKIKTEKNNGYVAIATVLVVGFIMLSAGMGATLNSINEMNASFAETQKEEALGFVESCVQDALLDIGKHNTLNTSIVLPDGTCTVTINSQVGNVWDFTTTGTLLGYKKNIKVNTTKGNTMTINSWLEI